MSSGKVKEDGSEGLKSVYLYGSKPCYLRRACSRSKARVKSINVETEIYWTAAHLSPDLSHQRCKRFEPALFHLYHTETLHNVQVRDVCSETIYIYIYIYMQHYYCPTAENDSDLEYSICHWPTLVTGIYFQVKHC